MNIVKLLLLLAVIGAGYHQWGRHKDAQAFASEAQGGSNGFVSVLMPSGARSGVVLVLAPENCPSEDAQRAASLADRLESLGIPVQRSNHFSSEVSNPTADQRDRLNRAVAVINGEVPAVFVNGMAKSNPSLEEVVAQYKGAK